MKKINKLFINTAIVTGGVLLSYTIIKETYKKIYNNFLKELEEEDYIKDEIDNIDDIDKIVDNEIALDFENPAFEGRKYTTLKKVKKS